MECGQREVEPEEEAVDEDEVVEAAEAAEEEEWDPEPEDWELVVHPLEAEPGVVRRARERRQWVEGSTHH